MFENTSSFGRSEMEYRTRRIRTGARPRSTTRPRTPTGRRPADGPEVDR